MIPTQKLKELADSGEVRTSSYIFGKFARKGLGLEK